jgi:hypothetical protein
MAVPTSPKRGWKRNSISGLVAALLILAAVIGYALDIPTAGVGAAKHDDLPAVALGQTFLYRVEVALLVFYGGLLLLTPLFRGVVEGQLPIEVSARGAKYAEDVAGSLKDTTKTVEDLGKQVNEVRGTLILTQLALQDAKNEIASLRDPQIPGLEPKTPREADGS